ncbi:hypothetical protein BDZ89DRAFT_1026853 [Hymenopellis radicata]|nr:hypothetical protein BDZ89DRAFT_1026853 [Hymenopellis radicata]
MANIFAPEDGETTVALTWKSLIRIPIDIVFTVDITDPHYQLCLDARQSLAHQFGNYSELTRAFISKLHQWPASLTKLVHLCADRFCIPEDLNTGPQPVLCPKSALDFMLFGMAFIRAMNRVRAERSEYYRRDVRLEDCDVHAAALLDILAGLWQKECTMRNRCIATRDDQVLPDHPTAGLPRRSMANIFAPEDGETTLALTWKSLIRIPIDIAFTVDITDPHYQLCLDARQSLAHQFSHSELTCAFLSKPRPLHQWPASLTKLIHLCADRAFCISKDMNPGSQPVLSPKSALDFMLWGMTFILAMNHLPALRSEYCSHVKCLLHRRRDVRLEDCDVHAASLLDILAGLWQKECAMRKREKWSPMPWSQASREELRRAVVIPVENVGTVAQYDYPKWDALDDSHELWRTIRSMFGIPIDIPWLEAHHDGYPYSPTLSGYANLRRTAEPFPLWIATMTFGLLEATFETKVRESDLISLDACSGRRVLSGARLLRLIFKWYRYRSDNKGPTFLPRGHAVALLLNRALRALNEENRIGQSLGERAGVDFDEVLEIWTAVGLMIITLVRSACAVWDSDLKSEFMDLELQTFNGSMFFFTHISHWCRRKLLAAGWCPNTVSHHFLLVMRRNILSNMLHLKPFIRESQDEHQHCTEDMCVFYTVANTDTYEVRHVESSCPCAEGGKTKPPDGEVQLLLSEGFLPVLQYVDGKLLVRRGQDTPYVAISHVWADGLGSTTEEGLPTCQVRRIAALARELLPESGAFWLDSLCVPDENPLRSKAIKLMAKTYRGAAKVLVLDASIRALCFCGGPWEYNILRIATSALVFEFADGLVDAVDLQTPPEPFQAIYYRQCLPLLAARLEHGAAVTQRKYTLDEIIPLMRLRTTTYAVDETIAIAALLPDKDVAALLDIDGKDEDAAQKRLALFLRQIRHLPCRLPMLHHRKMDLPHFRWAPVGLAAAAIESHGFGFGTCDEQGFRAEFMVGRLKEPITVPASCLTVDETQPVEEWFKLVVVHEETAATYKASFFVGCHSLTVARQLTNINAFLFSTPGDTFPGDDRRAEFAAVEIKDLDASGGPLRCDFVVPGHLSRLSHLPADALAAGCPAVMNLKEMDVLLT